MGLQPTTELNVGAGVVAGPFHPAYGELVYSALWLDALRSRLESESLRAVDLIIELHPKATSRVRGHNNNNLILLRREFNLTGIETQPNSRLPQDIVYVNGVSCSLLPD